MDYGKDKEEKQLWITNYTRYPKYLVINYADGSYDIKYYSEEAELAIQSKIDHQVRDAISREDYFKDERDKNGCRLLEVTMLMIGTAIMWPDLSGPFNYAKWGIVALGSTILIDNAISLKTNNWRIKKIETLKTFKDLIKLYNGTSNVYKQVNVDLEEINKVKSEIRQLISESVNIEDLRNFKNVDIYDREILNELLADLEDHLENLRSEKQLIK